MSSIQAVLFKKDKFTTDQCRSWLKLYKIKPMKRVHVTSSYYRYRIQDPSKFKRFVTKILDPDIDVVIGYK